MIKIFRTIIFSPIIIQIILIIGFYRQKDDSNFSDNHLFPYNHSFFFNHRDWKKIIIQIILIIEPPPPLHPAVPGMINMIINPMFKSLSTYPPLTKTETHD